MDFLIMGLPRSRTNWLSNFMTYGGSFCYHDLIGYVSSIDEYKEKMNIDYKYVGDSDSAGVFLENKFDCKKVIIHRSEKEVIDSCSKLFGFSEKIEDEISSLNNKLNLVDGLHIDFKDIDNRLSEIWRHCVKLPYDKNREKLLLNTRIQVKSMDMFNNLDFLQKLEAESCQ